MMQSSNPFLALAHANSDLQEATGALSANRAKPRAADEVLRDARERNSMYKMFVTNFNGKLSPRTVSMARVQFGDPDACDECDYPSSGEPATLPEMEEPVQVTRTLHKSLSRMTTSACARAASVNAEPSSSSVVGSPGSAADKAQDNTRDGATSPDAVSPPPLPRMTSASRRRFQCLLGGASSRSLGTISIPDTDGAAPPIRSQSSRADAPLTSPDGPAPLHTPSPPVTGSPVDSPRRRQPGSSISGGGDRWAGRLARLLVDCSETNTPRPTATGGPESPGGGHDTGGLSSWVQAFRRRSSSNHPLLSRSNTSQTLRVRSGVVADTPGDSGEALLSNGDGDNDDDDDDDDDDDTADLPPSSLSTAHMIRGSAHHLLQQQQLLQQQMQQYRLQSCQDSAVLPGVRREFLLNRGSTCSGHASPMPGGGPASPMPGGGPASPVPGGVGGVVFRSIGSGRKACDLSAEQTARNAVLTGWSARRRQTSAIKLPVPYTASNRGSGYGDAWNSRPSSPRAQSQQQQEQQQQQQAAFQRALLARGSSGGLFARKSEDLTAGGGGSTEGRRFGSFTASVNGGHMKLDGSGGGGVRHSIDVGPSFLRSSLYAPVRVSTTAGDFVQ